MTVWVADASPLLFLAKIDRLSALQNRAPEVLVPRAVADEVLTYPDQAAQLLRGAFDAWLRVVDIEDRRAVDLISVDLGSGEAEVLALAKERGASRVVLDDLDARRFAGRIGLSPVGTLGLLLAARLRGEIPSLEAEIVRLRAAGFYASEALVTAVLQAEQER